MTDQRVERIMEQVWRLVRSGPNFDGRCRDVEDSIKAELDAAIAAERERCARLAESFEGSIFNMSAVIAQAIRRGT